MPSLNKSEPFVIGVYHGVGKPTDSNVFLQELVRDANDLFDAGFDFEGKRLRVVIDDLFVTLLQGLW